MIKVVYEIDKDGFIITSHVAEVVDGVILDDDKQGFITVNHPSYFKPKWNGTEWVEGATQEEIDEITKVEPQPPTELELLKERLDITEQALTDLILGGM